MEAFGVGPGDALGDRELELSARLPDAVSDQLGLEAIDELSAVALSYPSS